MSVIGESIYAYRHGSMEEQAILAQRTEIQTKCFICHNK